MNPPIVAESSATPAVLTFSRTGPTTAALVVKYNRAGTATYLSDYTLNPAPGASFCASRLGGAARRTFGTLRDAGASGDVIARALPG